MKFVLAVTILSSVMLPDVKADDDESATTWGPTTAGCRLSIAADRASYVAGEPIRLEMTIENVGDETRYLRGAPYDRLQRFGFRFDVRVPDGPLLLSELGGEEIHMTREGKRRAEIGGSRSAPRLEAGKSATNAVPMLNRIYDMSVSAEYSVTVYWGIALPQGSEKPIEVESNTIKIIVHERDEDESVSNIIAKLAEARSVSEQDTYIAFLRRLAAHGPVREQLEAALKAAPDKQRPSLERALKALHEMPDKNKRGPE